MVSGTHAPVVSAVAGLVRRSRSALAAPLLVWVLAGVVVAALLLHDGQQNLNQAERDLVNERGRLVEQTAAYVSVTSDPGLAQTTLDAVPFSPTDAAADATLLRQFSPPQGGLLDLGEIRDRSGRPIVSVPAGDSVPITDLGPAWGVARAGGAAMSPVFRLHGQPRRATVAALGPTGRRWGVAVLVADESIQQRFDQSLGSLGTSPGGQSDVDARGVAFVSWNPALRGR
ncbi:MAG: diguanylate cyclase domain-containing protein, partial [Frankia sp.]